MKKKVSDQFQLKLQVILREQKHWIWWLEVSEGLVKRNFKGAVLMQERCLQ